MRPHPALGSRLARGSMTVTRIALVNHKLVGTFLELHDNDGTSRALNPVLNAANATDDDSVAALSKLKSVFADDSSAERKSQIVFAWHGTAAERLETVCRDGPRSLRQTDAGYFGAGSYFALEAAYAAWYAQGHPPNADDEYGVILYALSVSRVVPITLGNHYRTPAEERTVDSRLHGFSKFYSADASVAPALSPNCDAHFVPVRYYGNRHPVDNSAIPNDVDYQACPAAHAEGHEIVLHSHLRSIPVAIVYFQ
jgi:hypothetical protein